MSAVRLDSITVRRGGRLVLDNVDTVLAAGKLTAVIGPNGAGKSTLLEVAAGLLQPTAGTVRLDGAPMANIPRRTLARQRAYLPQDARVEWPISVERVIALGLSAQLPTFGPLPTKLQERIEITLERFELLPLRSRPATQLSGGELARVMLARATVGDPALLIVDEPTAGLDPRHAFDAAARLREVADMERTVIVALHDLDLAARIADEVLAVRDGRIVAHGIATEVLTSDRLSALYDVRADVRHTVDGIAIRFLG